jgi:glutathione peroxidase
MSGSLEEDGTMSSKIQQISVQAIDGGDVSLGDYQGDVLLVVNVASKCGLTPQYEALEAVHERFRDKGFAVLGFPANDFAGQEPGTNEEIVEFCSSTYGVQFPMFSKIVVTGQDKHPLYAELTSAVPGAEGDKAAFRDRLKGFGMTPTEDPEILWNFEKFLVSRDGEVIARFAPDVTPDDERITSAIERELQAG